MNEADTCRTYVLPKLKSAGWEDGYITEQMVLTLGRIVLIGDSHTCNRGLQAKVNSLQEGIAPAFWADVDAVNSC